MGDDGVAVQQDLAAPAQRHAGRCADHRKGSILHGLEGLLAERGRPREPIPRPRADREQGFAEIGPGGEVLPVVVDDEPRETVRHELECLPDERQAPLVQGVHPGVEFEAGDVPAGVPQARGVVSDHPRTTALHVGETLRSARPHEGRIAAGGAEPLDAPAGLAVEAALARRLQHRGRRPALGAEPIREPAGTEPVRHLEGACLPVVAEPHRGVDVGGVVRDPGHQCGRVREHRGEHPPRIAPLFAVVLDQGAQAPGLRGIDAGEADALRAVVLAGGQIDRLLDPLPALAPQPVEPALALAAGVAAGDHAPQHLGHLHVAAQVVVRRQQGVHAPGDVGHQVEADEVEEPEHPGLRDPRGRPQRRIRLLDPEPRRDRLDERALQPEHPDAVGDEPRRVLALHHPLAEAPVGEPAKPLHEIRPGLGAAHDLQQPHVAGRIEEMGDGEVPPQSLRSAFHEPGERDRGGVRGDDGAGAADRVEPRVEVALHVQALHHRLDDPVRFRHPRQVVVEVAGVDAAGRAPVHEGGRARLREPIDRGAGDGGPIRSVLRGDVQQEHARPRVGEVGRDPAAHHAGADHRDPFDRVAHSIASSTVAIPCPPPMHWVARA